MEKGYRAITLSFIQKTKQAVNVQLPCVEAKGIFMTIDNIHTERQNKW